MNSKIAPDLSIVVPTLNEAHNIGRLIPRLQAVLDPVRGGSFVLPGRIGPKQASMRSQQIVPPLVRSVRATWRGDYSLVASQ